MQAKESCRNGGSPQRDPLSQGSSASLLPLLSTETPGPSTSSRGKDSPNSSDYVLPLLANYRSETITI